MATAPTPGRVRTPAKRRGFRVKLYSEVYELDLRDVGPADEGLVRQTTGRPLSRYLNEFGIDSIAVIIWLARRKAGERKLQLSKVFDMVPSYYEFNELVEAGEADFEQLEDLADDADLDDVDLGAEVPAHPLEIAAP